jgi:L-proline amide hydrolase
VKSEKRYDNESEGIEGLQQDPEVYNVMNGPSEFHVIGLIKDWDIIPRLGEIHEPTLVLSGRYEGDSDGSAAGHRND